MAEERLQKLLAHAGIASRRKAEQMILEGQVTVNGKIVNALASVYLVPLTVVAVVAIPLMIATKAGQ